MYWNPKTPQNLGHQQGEGTCPILPEENEPCFISMENSKRHLTNFTLKLTSEIHC